MTNDESMFKCSTSCERFSFRYWVMPSLTLRVLPHPVHGGFQLGLRRFVELPEEIEARLLLDVVDGGEELLGEFGAFHILRHDDREDAQLAAFVVFLVDDDFVEGRRHGDAGLEAVGGAAVEVGEDGAVDDPDLLEGVGEFAFGGFKASGVGREHGREGLHAYHENKTVWVNLG